MVSRRPPRGVGPVAAGGPTSTAPDTIVLVHGFWVTPRSWEDWILYYEAKGYKVIAPAYPGFEVEVEALNADHSIVAELTADAVIDHLVEAVAAIETPPIIIGHSAGGAFTQVLLDRGYGAAGVAICSAPTEGVRALPLSQLRSVFPAFKNPANRHRAVPLTFEQWHYAFTNTFDEDRSRQLYERYAVPASGNILWNSVLANFEPGPQDIAVDYKNEERAPLLFISASDDHIMPPKIQQSNAKHYKGKTTTTEVIDVDGPHLIPAIDGWEKVADAALDWAVEHATTRG